MERIFVLDARLVERELIIDGVNDILCKVERNLGFLNHTYCVVYDDLKFEELLKCYTTSSVSIEKITSLSSNTRNLFDSMVSNKPLNVTATLVQLQVINELPSLIRFLKNNNHHTAIFNYSKFFDKPINCLAMKYSIQKQEKIFKFITITNNYCTFKGTELISVQATDDWPFKHLPLVTFDLEVVAERLETFPLGLKHDEIISHLAIVVNYRGNSLCYAIVVQGADRISPIKEKNKIIITVEKEKDLLLQLAADFTSHKFLRALGLSKNMAFLCTGYNIDNFDLPYIYARCVYHKLFSLANIFSTKTGLSPNAFSFDLWHAEARVFAGIQNCSLKKVSEMFLNENKIPLNVTAIRKLYNGQNEDLDFQKSSPDFYFKKDGTKSNVPTAKHFLDYNIQDCLLIPKLFEKQAVLDLLHRMCVFCNIPYYEAISCGNSRRLENLMFIFALNKHSWLLPIQNNYVFEPQEIPTEQVQTFQTISATNSLLQQIQNIDKKSYDLGEITRICKNYSVSLDDESDEIHFVKSTKGFAGGANDAVRYIGRNVFGLDAESFYPSIIKEYNLDLNNVLIINSSLIPAKFHQTLCKKHYVFAYSNLTKGVIDTETWKWPQLYDISNYHDLVLIILKTKSMLRDLVQQLLDDRNECKILLKREYDATIKAKELSYKVMSCCVFGVLGYKNFIYDRIFVAAAITFLARNILSFCIQRLKPKGVKIVYVDTDGIMCSAPFVRTQADVDKLSVEISKELGFSCIKFKPESLYKIANILSCKKYITLENELVCKGFEKNAIPPIKELMKDWFNYYFKYLLQFKQNEYKVTIHAPSLILAAFTYLDKIKCNFYDWSVTKTVKEKSSSLLLTAFYQDLISRGTNIGDRVNILALLDSEGNEFFALVETYQGEQIDFKYLLRNYLQYLISFSSIEFNKVNNNTLDKLFLKFLQGSRLEFDQVPITIESV